MIKCSQTVTVLLVLLHTPFLGIYAQEASKLDRIKTSQSERSNKAQGYELTYLKNKKNFYRSLSIFSKTGATINLFSWAFFTAYSFKSKIWFDHLKWLSKNARLALASAVALYFLSQWLDLEQIPLDGQIADLENELTIE